MTTHPITELPEYLSASDKKRAIYGIDEAFLSSWRDITFALKDEAEAYVTSVTYILFKPEAIVARNIEQGLQFLKGHDFRPIAFAPVRLGPETVQRLWRYQLNLATPERIGLINTLVSAADSLFVLVQDERMQTGLSAAMRLNKLKGPSSYRKRTPEQLRFQFGLQSDFLNFVHTPNEPADFTREFGVFFLEAERRALLRAMLLSEDRSNALLGSLTQLYSRFPQHDLSFRASLDRLKADCVQLIKEGGNGSVTCEEIVKRCDELSTECDGEHELLFNLIDRIGLRVNIWDWITINAFKVGPNLPGVKPIFD